MKRLQVSSTLSVICLVAVLSLPAFAQETTGGLQGTIKDPSEAVIPSATVEVTGPSLIGKKSTVSDSGGFFRIDQLPSGVYTVTVTFPGFATKTLNNLEIKTGELPTINLVLQVGAAQAVSVDVSTTAEVLDVTLSKVQTIISEDILTAIPKGRSYQSVIPFAPGARQEPLSSSRENRSNGFQIDGATDSENVYLIDGVNTTNIQGGGVGKDFQSDFIQEVQVKSSGFEAEFGGALGGVINAVAKRGSSSWHGEVKGYFQSAALDATDPCAAGFTAGHLPAYWTFLNSNVPSGYTGLECGLRLNPSTALNTTARLDGTPQYFIPKKDSRHLIEPGYEIGGPLLKDKLWLFSSYIPSLDSIARTVDFKCPGTTVCTFAGPRRFTQNYTQHNAYNRLDYRLTSSIRLFGSWNYAYSRLTGSLPAPDSAAGQVNSGATIDPGTIRSDAGAVNPYALYNFSGDWTATPKLLISARYGYFFNNFSSRGTPTGTRYIYDQALNAASRDVNNNPFPSNAPFNNSGFSNIPNNFATIYDSFNRKSFNTDASYFLGNVAGAHNLKVGYMWQAQNNDVLISANSNVVDLYWGIKYSPATSATACAAVQAGNAAGLCQGQYGYFLVGSLTTSTSGSTNATEQAFYLQDSWIVKNTGLTLNLGVRFDREHNPPYNPGVIVPVEFGWNDKIAPRLGGAYDVLHNGKLKLYGSYGKFYDIMKLNLMRSKSAAYWHQCAYALDTVDYTTITPTLATGSGCPVSGPAPGVNARFIENQNLRAQNNDARDPGFQVGMKPISSHEFTTGADWAISSKMLFETRYTRKRLDQTIEDMAITDNLGFYNGNPGTTYGDVLHRPTLIPDANGVLYVNTVPFCDECPHGPKPERRYDSVEFRLTRRGGARWFGTVSYTYSKLRGNYSGLVDSDPTDANGGRHSPNTARAFDLPTMTFTPSGKPDDGPLSTDRPHTAKVFGYYRLPWLGQETSFGVSQMMFQGTPISTCIGTVSGTNPASSCQVAEGRGNFVQAHRDTNGNLVKDGVIQDYRTPAYFQTDLSVRHEIKVGGDNEKQRIVIEANAINVLNQHSATSYYQFLAAAGSVAPLRASRFSGDPRYDWGKMMNGYDYVDAFNATGSFAGVQTPLTLSNRYGNPRTFQSARQLRLAVRYVF